MHDPQACLFAMSDAKPCPFCSELILKDAVVCRYCHTELATGRSGESGNGAKSKQRHHHDEPEGMTPFLRLLLLLVLLLFLVIVWRMFG